MLTLLRSLTRIPGGSLKTGTPGVAIGASTGAGGGGGWARDGFEASEKSESVRALPPPPPVLLLRSTSLWSDESSPPLVSSVERSSREVPNKLIPEDAIETGPPPL